MCDVVFGTFLTFIKCRFFCHPLAFSLWIYKELYFLFFVFILIKNFLFLFYGLQGQKSWSGFDTLIETLGQQNNFQSQIGGNCD